MDSNIVIVIILVLGAGSIALRFWLRFREARKYKEEQAKRETEYFNKN